MNNLEIVLSKLNKVRKIGSEFQACCPCHDDKHASLSITEDNGKLLMYCHAGCSFEKIIKALDLPKDFESELSPVITKTYDYTDTEGRLLYQVVRYFPKAFKQRRPDSNGGWIWDLKGITPTLYHLPEVLAAIKDKTIYIVEGEKDVDTLVSHGLTATTISGGASSKWSDEVVALLEGGNFVIIPDNDPPGLKYAEYVANRLLPIEATIKLVYLSKGKDVTDYLETQPISNLLFLAKIAPFYIPKGVVQWCDMWGIIGLCHYLIKENRRLSQRKKHQEYD